MHDDPRPGSIPAAAEERAAFEAWAAKALASGKAVRSWEIWQAAWASCSAALAAPKAEAWIDVNDRLPTECGLYWVYCPQSYHKFTTAEWGPVGMRMGDERYGWVREFKRRTDVKPKTWIDHWMPIHAPTSPAPQEEPHD